MKVKNIELDYNQEGQEKRGKRARGGRRAGGGGGRSKGVGSRVGVEKSESTEWNKIPFAWVIRGRQESHLIDQQVRCFLFCTTDCGESSRPN